MARWSLLLVALAVAGCAAPDPCDLEFTTSVVKVEGTDVHVEGDLILHAAQSKVFRAPGCTPISVAEIHPGDGLAHDADAIAESFPMQAWPKTIVIRPPHE